MAKGPTNRLPNGLTPKQNKFVAKVLQNVATTGELKATEAALETYNTTDTDVARDIGGENLRKPAIKEAIEKALADSGLIPSLILPELGAIAKAEVSNITGDTKLRALDMILKLQGAYPNQSKPVLGHSVSLTFQSINFNEAKEQLKTLDSELSEFIDIND